MPVLFRLRPLLLSVVVLSSAGCAQEEPAVPEALSVIERDVFIATYVDLREAAIRAGGEELTDSTRQAVLDRHTITEEELLRFAEVRGTDIAFMRDVWAEVGRRLEERRLVLDSVGSR